MFSITRLLFPVLLASIVLAIPSNVERFARRLERRDQAAHKGDALQLSDRSNLVKNQIESDDTAGAAFESYPNGTFTGIKGTSTVPSISVSGSSSTFLASAWIGIDGVTCDTAIWQTGIDFSIDGGAVTYDAWYEWYPDYAYDFSGMTISAGDEIALTLTATSKTAGAATIENLTQGKTVSKTVTSTYALCEANAEWMVEVYEQDSVGPIPKFTVAYTDAAATSTSGILTPNDATIIEQAGVSTVSATTNSVTIVFGEGVTRLDK